MAEKRAGGSEGKEGKLSKKNFEKNVPCELALIVCVCKTSDNC